MNSQNLEKKIEEQLRGVEVEGEKLKELEVLRDYDKDDRVVSSEELREEMENEFSKPSVKMSSNIETLDKLIGGGFKPGTLTTITGITKSGKSTLARTICHNLVQQEINSLYFSYEETEHELLEKFPEPYPIFYLPRRLSSFNTEWIHLRIGEAVAKYGAQAVFIDNLDFLLSKDIYKMHGNISDLIKFIMIDLKNTMRHWEVAGFLLCHTTQEGTRRGVEIGDLKGSASIGQISDFVIAIRRLKNKDTGLDGDKSKVKVLANRENGRTGEIKMVFENNLLKEVNDYNLEEDNL